VSSHLITVMHCLVTNVFLFGFNFAIKDNFQPFDFCFLLVSFLPATAALAMTMNNKAAAFITHFLIYNINITAKSYQLPFYHSLRSANRNCLTVPRCRLSTYGCRAFHYAGPTVWNSLPDGLGNSDSFDSFKRFTKTILFSRC